MTAPTQAELRKVLDVLQRQLGASKRVSLSEIRKMTQEEVAALPPETIEAAFEEEAEQA